jgi:hypothetical protein
MKTIITTLLILFPFLIKAQNGGQFPENNVIKVEYLGYFNGNHTAKVCNKQNCEARIRTKVDQDPAVDIIVPANGCIVVTVARPTSAAVLFRAKAETSCPSFTNPDMGWLETTFISSVLNLTENNTIRIVRGPNVYEVKLVGDILKSDFGSGTDIQNVDVYNLFGQRIFNQKQLVNKKHQINLQPYLRSGINFIVVSIENRASNKFTIQVIR